MLTCRQDRRPLSEFPAGGAAEARCALDPVMGDDAVPRQNPHASGPCFSVPSCLIFTRPWSSSSPRTSSSSAP
jgi:hypothetical protein